MNDSEKKEFGRIIVPVDGSDASKKAAGKAFSLADQTGLNVILMHVVEIPQSAIPTWNQPKPEWTETVKKEGYDLLNDIKESGEKKGVNIDTKLVEGIPDDEIINEANPEDLIVMGGKGHSAMDRVLIGSVSEKVLHHSDSTVMIVR
jgi:nucleotide-binding universal stress UspA family protein